MAIILDHFPARFHGFQVNLRFGLLWNDAGLSIGIDTFGASAPASELFEKFGFSVAAIVEKAVDMVEES